MHTGANLNLDKVFPFLGVMPPRLRRLAGHESRNRDENIQNAGIMAGFRLLAQPPVEHYRIFADQLRGRIDTDKLQVFSHGRTNIWQISEAFDLTSLDLCGIHCTVRPLERRVGRERTYAR